jgi:3-dehydroquinate synthase
MRWPARAARGDGRGDAGGGPRGATDRQSADTLRPSTVTAREIHLPTYRVTVAAGLLDALGTRVAAAAPAYRYAIVTDDAVGALYADRVRATFPPGAALPFSVPAGEAHKTRESWARLTDEILAAGCGRDTTVVALGGGVVGDLAGFVASTFMRGIPYVQVPTTLLAMIDASIGGKTGVDTPAGKNLVGTFHQPAAVLVDPTALATLPSRHLRAGLAEAVKHGVIADESYFDRLVGDLPALLEPAGAVSEMMTSLVARSIEIKAAIVRRDEREGGVRKVLNLGHTLGHAIELLSSYEMLHGEAVAIGMALESELAEHAGIAACGTTARIRDALARAGLPVDRPDGMSPDRIIEATRSDKKARRGVVEYALPRRVGAMAAESSGWTVAVDDALVREVLA